MTDPKGTHAIDQAIAAMRATGAGLAAMMGELTAQDIPLPEATRIVCAYASGLAAAQVRPEPRRRRD